MPSPFLRLCSVLGAAWFATAAFAAPAPAPVQSERLTKAWETSDPLPGPTGALYDEVGDVVYVSRTEGTVKEANVRGFIAKVATDGKVLAAEWIAGLDAPRGLARSATRLFVTDGQEIFSIDPERARIASRFRNDHAKRLHAVAVLANGSIFASDTAGGLLFELRDGIFGQYQNFDTVPANTALLAAGDELLLGQRSRITGFTPANEHTRDVVRRAVAVESMVALADGTFLVADGKSAVHLVGAGVEKPIKLLDTGAPAAGLGLIGWIPKSRVLLVPLPAAGKLVAYQFK